MERSRLSQYDFKLRTKKAVTVLIVLAFCHGAIPIDASAATTKNEKKGTVVEIKTATFL